MTLGLPTVTETSHFGERSGVGVPHILVYPNGSSAD